VRAPVALALALLATGSAIAGPPEFLSGKRYTATEAGCTGGGEETDDIGTLLELNETGIYTYEFGCSFLEFWPGDDPNSEQFLQTVLASCGDDSGITRPDTFSLVFNDGDVPSVVVQSQNEYVTGSSFVSRTYSLCTAPVEGQ
jgi:hypothetical protein